MRKISFLFGVLAFLASPNPSFAQTPPPVTALIDCDPSTPRIYEPPSAHIISPGRTCDIHCGEGNIVGTAQEVSLQCFRLIECVWDAAQSRYQPDYDALPAGTACDINGNSCDRGFCSGTGECFDSGSLNLPDGAECEDLDGNPCTIEHCEEGACRRADPNDPADNVDCNDGNSCTTEICDASIQIRPGRPRTDACVYTAVPYGTTDPSGRLVCEGCGDGIVQAANGETCDDGNNTAGDGCGAQCGLEFCGNGQVEGAEQCDDGNVNDGDGCSSACRDEALVCPGLTCSPVTFPYNPSAATAVTCTVSGGNWQSAFIDCEGTPFPVTPANPSAQCLFGLNGAATVSLVNATNGPQTADCGSVTVTATASCGDQILNQPGEQCDNGANNSDAVPDACRSDCTNSRCGDGVADTGEGCDDGNLIDTDSCTRACALPTCGDGNVQAGEDCDDANADNTDGCLATCEFARCGDGFTQIGVEACDDGNADNADACLTACRLPFCGDGFTRVGFEECDDANADNTDACLLGCRAAVCGDGFTRTGVEACDDGNLTDDDACTRRCAPPACGDGLVQRPETCDDGNTVNEDECLNSCLFAQCGDGFTQIGVEECDDANRSGTDSCLSDCTGARCGDGLVRAGVEACDAGALNSDTRADACRSNCQPARCGDGVLDALEACDDGNANDRDACHNNCTIPLCIPDTEVCDGRDNDCDGLTDEELGETACGEGACRVVAQNCVNGAPSACVPLPAIAEFCNDQVDNDCDGLTDENCDIGPICDGPDENGDGIPDVCLTPTQSCLSAGGKVEELPNISIQDILESRNHSVSIEDGQYVIENGVITGRCVQIRAAAKFAGSSIFGAFSPAETLALLAWLIWARRPRRRL